MRRDFLSINLNSSPGIKHFKNSFDRSLADRRMKKKKKEKGMNFAENDERVHLQRRDALHVNI